MTRVEDLANNRTSHTATLIADTAWQQSILFVGGGGGSCSRELYMVGRGPTVLDFEGVCRIDHTATVLDDGRVLIVGGQDSLKIASETLASAELYSPATEEFSVTGSLGTARYGHNATLLDDGTALIAGGFMTDYLLHKVRTASAEMYDPGLGRFSQLPDMNYPRADHTTTLLADGSVLVVGGTTEPAPIEKYVPQEKRFRVIPDTEFARSNHSATLLEDGRALIAGGIDLNGTTLADATLFDPDTGSFSAAGLMKVGRAGHTASRLPGRERGAHGRKRRGLLGALVRGDIRPSVPGVFDYLPPAEAASQPHRHLCRKPRRHTGRRRVGIAVRHRPCDNAGRRVAQRQSEAMMPRHRARVSHECSLVRWAR